MARLAFALFAALAGTVLPPSLLGTADAGTGPPGFVVEPAFPGAEFRLPVQIVFLADGRKLVPEARGQVWVFTADGQRLPTPFVDLNERVMCCGGRGLLSVALDPDFGSNRWVYFLYVVDPDSDGVDFDSDSECYSRLERYQVSATDSNQIDTATRQVLFGTQWSDGIPSADIYHTIGSVRFGRDKSLLVSTGDGAHFDTTDAGGLDPGQFLPGRSDPNADVGSFRSRTLDNLGGKILRLDKETGHGLPTNPYWNGDPMSTRSRIWVYGLRNPYRFCVKPGTGSTNLNDGQPGTLYIGDTGWNTFESVFVARTSRLNYGWPCWEGPSAQPLYNAVVATASGDTAVLCGRGPNAENPTLRTAPLMWWHHTDPSQSRPTGWSGRAAIGGVFQAGGNYPSPYTGAYFVTDFVNGWIRYATVDTADALAGSGDFVNVDSGSERVSDVEVDPASGELYYVTIQIDGVVGEVHRVRYSPIETPRLMAWKPDSASGVATYASPGATSPWKDLGSGHHDVTLVNFNGTPASGWLGDGTASSPFRLQLDGIDDRVELAAGSVPELQNPSGATVSLWVRTGTDVTREQYLIDWVQSSSSHPGMRLSLAAGHLRLWLDPWVNVATLQPSAWYHVVATKDSSGVRVYMNGTLQYTSPTSLLAGQQSRLVLGAAADGPGVVNGENFAGAFGDCIVWCSRLAAIEVLALYQRTVSLYEPSAAQVLGFRAEQANGTGAYLVPGAQGPWRDLTGGDDATLSGFDGTLASGWRGTGSVSSPHRLQFDGVNDRVVIPAASVSSLQSPSSATIAVWLKTGTNVTSDQRVFEWLSGYVPPYAGMAIGISNGFLRALADTWVDVVAVQPDTWYYVTIVKQSNTSRVYVNGLTRYQSPTANLGAQVSEIVFGASTQTGPGLYDHLFSGAIGGVDVWRRALLDPEVQEFFYDDASRYIEPPGLGAIVLHLAADSALAGMPPPVPGAGGPWRDLLIGAGATLQNFQGSISSGWMGLGTSTAPYRLQFDGADDAVVVSAGSIVPLQTPASVSVAMWVLTGTDVVRNQYLMEWVAQFAPPSPGMSLSVSNGRLRLWLSPWADLGPVSPLAWYHVVVTKDVDAVRAYVNGQPVFAGDRALLGGQLSDLVLGASTYSGPGVYGDRWSGAIADVRVWPVSLAYDEARALWETQNARFAGPWSPTAVEPSEPAAWTVRERPNPFRHDVDIEFAMPRAAAVRLEILSVDGRRVRTLAATTMAAGTHRLRWDGRDESGSPVGQGMYFAHLRMADHETTRRLVFLQ